MLARKAALATELRAINDKPAGDNGDLSTEQRGRWDAVKAELDGLEARIARQTLVDDLDRRTPGEPLDGTRGNDLPEVGLLDAIRAQMGATDAAAGRAREVSQELARRSGRSPEGIYWNMGQAEYRTLTTTTPPAGPGGNLVPTNYRPDLFIDRLRNATKVRALGATVLSGLTGNVVIPRRTGSVVAQWVNENSPLTPTDQTFDGVQLSPKHCGAMTDWSRNMIQQASPDVEALARADMAAVLGEALDAAAINGTGVAPQPRGILNTPGIGTNPLGTNGGALSYDAITDLMGTIADANATASGFLTNTRVFRASAKLKDTSNKPFGTAAVFQGARVELSNLVPSNLTKGTGTNLSALIYGNWADLMIGVWSELDILVNPYLGGSYERGNVSIRAMMTVDVAVRHPESFAAIKDIATPNTTPTT